MTSEWGSIRQLISALIPLIILRLSVDLRPFFSPLLVFHRNKLTGISRFSGLFIDDVIGFVRDNLFPIFLPPPT